jgi:4-hydroxy-tetrahydrodipicolinate synthase
LAGDDPMTYLVMTVGGKGVISASASVIPEKMLAITENAKAGKWQEAFQAQLDALPIINALFLETNPSPAKAALALMGKIPSDAVRLPLVPASGATKAKLREVLGL